MRCQHTAGPLTRPAATSLPGQSCPRTFRWLPLAVLCLFVLVGCGERSDRAVLRGATMGTTWSVIYRDEGGPGPGALTQAIEVELAAINDALSTYMPDSEISRLNDADGSVERVLSTHFATVLEAAFAIGRLSGGAYDVTVAPLIDLWGFGAEDFSGRVPPPAAIDAALDRVGMERLRWDGAAARLARPPGVRIDLSSIAKGYAVDRLSDLLAAQGISDSLVEIGGELRARGERPEGGPWRLAVESPDPAQARFVEALALNDAAVATSGDYRNYFEVDGRRYSHLVDPRTGYPVAHELVSVTVVADRCMLADGFATALIVLGLEEGMALARSQGIAAHFVTRGPDGLAVDYTQEFERYRQAAGAGRAGKS